MRRRRLIVFALTVTLLFGLVGCGETGTENGPEETEETPAETASAMTDTAAETEEETEIQIRRETEAQTEPSQETADVRRYTIIGTLEDLTTEEVTVFTDNGNELSFSVRDAQIDLPSGIRVGNLVAIEYTGEITRDGTEGACAVRVAGSADTFDVSDASRTQEDVTEEDGTQEEEIQEDETQKDAADDGSADGTGENGGAGAEIEIPKVLSGTLTALGMSTLTMEDAAGVEHTFRIVNVPLYFSKGLYEGMTVSVVYTGDLTGGENEETVEVSEITDD